MDRFRMLPNYQYHDDGTGILETQYKKEMRDYQIYGNSIQDGTPSPDNPIEIQSVGEKTTNLWGKETATAYEDSYGTMKYEWDDKGGVYFYNTSVVTKSCAVDLTLPAGTYSVWMSTYGYIRKNGSLIRAGSFATVSSAEEFVLRTDIILNSGKSIYFQVMVVEGTYTEDTMPEFEPQGKYKIPIEVSGKNLFDISKIVETSKIKIIDSKTIVVSDYPANTTKKLKELCPAIKIGQTIKFSMKTNGYHQIYFKNLNSDNTQYVSNGNLFTATEDLLNANLYFYRQTSAQGGGSATIYNIQFEEGTKTTPYEPYREPQTYNIFLDEPLRKCGDDYADYIDFKNGKLVRNTDIKVFDGTESWYISGAYFALASWDNKLTPAHSSTEGYYLGLKCNIATRTTLEGASYYYFKTHNNLGVDWIIFPFTDNIITLDGWKSYLQENQVYVEFPLATSIETVIELPKILLNKGTNIIKVKTVTEPYEVNWQYYK